LPSTSARSSTNCATPLSGFFVAMAERPSTRTNCSDIAAMASSPKYISA